MITGSLQNLKGMIQMPPQIIPYNPTLSNYEMVLKNPILMWSGNSLIVLFGTVILSVLISCSAGYCFAFYSFKFKELLWAFLLIGTMVPRISIIIPLFVIIKMLGIPGTLFAVVLPLVYTPVGLYLARQYFETIPKSIVESAKLDGASEMMILYKIIMPISAPIVSSLAIFASIGSLQDYIWQALVLQKDTLQTLIVGLTRYIMTRNLLGINPVGKSLAVGTLLLIPLVIIFAVGNRYFIKSIDGAIKE
jgi:multiple sugar transport system permease protein